MLVRKSFVRGIASLLGVAGIVIAGLLPFAPVAHALTIVPECAKQSETPSLECMMLAFVNVANFIFSIAGSAALLMFVIGGFLVLTSAGNDSKVKAGKEYLKNAVIGLFIIFTAAYVIQYGVGKLTEGKITGATAERCADYGKQSGTPYKCEKADTGGDGCMPGFSDCAAGFVCCPSS